MTHKISLKVSQVGNKTVFYGDRGAEPAPLALFSPSNNEIIPPSGSDTCVTSTACEINYFYRLKKGREKEGRRGRNKGADLFSSHPRYLWEEKTLSGRIPAQRSQGCPQPSPGFGCAGTFCQHRMNVLKDLLDTKTSRICSRLLSCPLSCCEISTLGRGLSQLWCWGGCLIVGICLTSLPKPSSSQVPCKDTASHLHFYGQTCKYR